MENVRREKLKEKIPTGISPLGLPMIPTAPGSLMRNIQDQNIVSIILHFTLPLRLLFVS